MSACWNAEIGVPVIQTTGSDMTPLQSWPKGRYAPLVPVFIHRSSRFERPLVMTLPFEYGVFGDQMGNLLQQYHSQS